MDYQDFFTDAQQVADEKAKGFSAAHKECKARNKALRKERPFALSFREPAYETQTLAWAAYEIANAQGTLAQFAKFLAAHERHLREIYGKDAPSANALLVALRAMNLALDRVSDQAGEALELSQQFDDERVARLKETVFAERDA